jgi:hypothetical protein
MNRLLNIAIFVVISIFSYFFTHSTLALFTPQLIALISIVFIILLFKKYLSFHLISFIITLLVFYSGALNSSFFFLIYFLLFTIAFQNPPSTTLSYSLVLILLLSQSLDSLSSIIPLASLLLITPLAYFIGKQHLEKTRLETDLVHDETSVLLWLSLKFKTAISQVIDDASQLLSTPLQHNQKEQLRHLKKTAKTLLNSSQKLTKEIDDQSDDD